MHRRAVRLVHGSVRQVDGEETQRLALRAQLTGTSDHQRGDHDRERGEHGGASWVPGHQAS